MKAMRQSSCLLLPLLLLAGCEDQPVANGYGSTTPRYERPIESKSNLESAVVAVRIGELGRNFAACNAQGEVRERATNGAMPVRAALSVVSSSEARRSAWRSASTRAVMSVSVST